MDDFKEKLIMFIVALFNGLKQPKCPSTEE